MQQHARAGPTGFGTGPGAPPTVGSGLLGRGGEGGSSAGVTTGGGRGAMGGGAPACSATSHRVTTGGGRGAMGGGAARRRALSPIPCSTPTPQGSWHIRLSQI